MKKHLGGSFEGSRIKKGLTGVFPLPKNLPIVCSISPKSFPKTRRWLQTFFIFTPDPWGLHIFQMGWWKTHPSRHDVPTIHGTSINLPIHLWGCSPSGVCGKSRWIYQKTWSYANMFQKGPKNSLKNITLIFSMDFLSDKLTDLQKGVSSKEHVPIWDICGEIACCFFLNTLFMWGFSNGARRAKHVVCRQLDTKPQVIFPPKKWLFSSS